MNHREFFQLFLATGSQANPDLAPILGTAGPFDQSAFLHAVHQPYGAVMANEEMIGQFSDGRAFGGSFEGSHRQQKLMLLRLQTFLAGSELAEMKEVTDAEAKFSERQIVVGAERRCVPGHINIVSRYDRAVAGSAITDFS